jgi:glycosyltransferase involved in cell wall biosynthesis
MFSIVIPLYNKAQYICHALESIHIQSERNFEVIIIDDGSSDDGFEVASKWIFNLPIKEIDKYKIYRKSNEGVSSSRNLGVIKSAHQYVAFLDADDYWAVDHLRNLRSLVEDYASAVDIFSNAVSHLSFGKMLLPKLGKFENFRGVCSFLEATSISNGFIHSSSVCVKRSVFENIKFPEGMSNCEDILTWARISGVKGFAFSSERTAVYCIDVAEGSLNIDISNYSRFEREFNSIGFPSIPACIFLFRFYLMHLMFAKLYMKSSFIKQWRRVFGQSVIATVTFVAVVLCPTRLIRCLRNLRKDIK